jgi:hypothetical protein
MNKKEIKKKILNFILKKKVVSESKLYDFLNLGEDDSWTEILLPSNKPLYKLKFPFPYEVMKILQELVFENLIVLITDPKVSGKRSLSLPLNFTEGHIFGNRFMIIKNNKWGPMDWITQLTCNFRFCDKACFEDVYSKYEFNMWDYLK